MSVAEISGLAEKRRGAPRDESRRTTSRTDRGAEINGSFRARTRRREARRAEVQAIDPPPPVDLPSIFALLLCLPTFHPLLLLLLLFLSLSSPLPLFRPEHVSLRNSSTVFHRYTQPYVHHTYTRDAGESRARPEAIAELLHMRVLNRASILVVPGYTISFTPKRKALDDVGGTKRTNAFSVCIISERARVSIGRFHLPRRRRGIWGPEYGPIKIMSR